MQQTLLSDLKLLGNDLSKIHKVLYDEGGHLEERNSATIHMRSQKLATT